MVKRQLGRTVAITPGDATRTTSTTGEIERIEAALASGEWEHPVYGHREPLPARVRRRYELRLEELTQRRTSE